MYNFSKLYKNVADKLFNSVVQLPHTLMKIINLTLPRYVTDNVHDPMLLMKVFASYCFYEFNSRELYDNIKYIKKCRNCAVHGHHISEETMFDLIRSLEQVYDYFNNVDTVNIEELKLAIVEIKKLINYDVRINIVLKLDVNKPKNFSSSKFDTMKPKNFSLSKLDAKSKSNLSNNNIDPDNKIECSDAVKLDNAVEVNPATPKLVESKTNNNFNTSNDNTIFESENDIIVEGSLCSLKEKYSSQIKHKPMEMLDGIHKGRRGQITGFNGNSIFITFNDNKKRIAVNLGRQIKINLGNMV